MILPMNVRALREIRRREADERARHRARDQENRQIVHHARRAEHEPRHEKLADIVEHAARNADADGGEEVRFFQQDHARKREDRAREAIKKGRRIAEKKARKQDAQKRYGDRGRSAETPESEDHDDIAEPELHARNRDKGWQSALHEGEDHGKRKEERKHRHVVQSFALCFFHAFLPSCFLEKPLPPKKGRSGNF